MKMFCFVLLSALSLTGCHSEVQRSQSAHAAAPSRKIAAPGRSRVPSRKIKVSDSEFMGYSFDVFLDGVQLGTVPVDEEANWGKDLAPGTHRLDIVALPGGASKSTEVWVSLYSGTRYPFSFFEPQPNGAKCQFLYSSVDFGKELVGLGKQNAACRIHPGERLSLLVQVPEDHPAQQQAFSEKR